jgi:hypothetical protein
MNDKQLFGLMLDMMCAARRAGMSYQDIADVSVFALEELGKGEPAGPLEGLLDSLESARTRAPGRVAKPRRP